MIRRPLEAGAMHRAAAGGAVPADRLGRAARSIPGRGPRRSGTRRTSSTSHVPERPVFLDPRRRSTSSSGSRWRSCSTGWSSRQDATADPAPSRRLQRLSGPGLGPPVPDRDVRRDRLGDVARARLVLDDLRRDADRRRCAGDAGADDRRRRRSWRPTGRWRRWPRRDGSTTWAT